MEIRCRDILKSDMGKFRCRKMKIRPTLGDQTDLGAPTPMHTNTTQGGKQARSAPNIWKGPGPKTEEPAEGLSRRAGVEGWMILASAHKECSHKQHVSFGRAPSSEFWWAGSRRSSREASPRKIGGSSARKSKEHKGGPQKPPNASKEHQSQRSCAAGRAPCPHGNVYIHGCITMIKNSDMESPP